MKFKADLHIHSSFSRATSKSLNLENLYIAAQLKGLTVIGTGDITHPQWFSSIKEKLVEKESGLFCLKKEIAKTCQERVPNSCRADVRFMLVSEISNIYKKNGRTRKNHNLVFMPDIASVEKFNAKLDSIGNIKSDGRPILGLDARNLLDIALNISDKAFLIPAHIWTPWFSLLGSKSGFDSLDECFEDLTDYIFAVETGLSSDPPMNWRVSGLDRLTLVSNSDAHSPMNLGREANLFDTTLSFDSIKDAIKTGDPEKFLGTLEFFPEEGKYHFDGHRKCGICYNPRQTIENRGICPVCGKELTRGVLYRVEELADRDEGQKPAKSSPFYSIVSLDVILSEILAVGPSSKKVKTYYDKVLDSLGSELAILNDIDIDLIDNAKVPLLKDAIKKIRSGNIVRSPGFDGEFGKIKIFEDGEKEKLMGHESIFSFGSPQKKSKKDKPQKQPAKQLDFSLIKQPTYTAEKKSSDLNIEQLEAVTCQIGPLLIEAGPGTGKTLTLTRRIAWLIQEKNVPPQNILAVTFTNRAAQEMRQRIAVLLENSHKPPVVDTFHGFCLKILEQEGGDLQIADEMEADYILSDAITYANLKGLNSTYSLNAIRSKISAANINTSGDIKLKSYLELDDKDAKTISEIYRIYKNFLTVNKKLDFDCLIYEIADRLEKDDDFRQRYKNRFSHIFVDEYQDINYGQYKIIKGLADKNICVIGDKDQSIYGFRGSDDSYFSRFTQDFPGAKIITLSQNYRSTETILKASSQIISKKDVKTRIYSDIKGVETITVIETPSAKAEAVAIGKIIEKMVGGIGFHSIDFGAAESFASEKGFADFAVVYRTNEQAAILHEVLTKAGIPCRVIGKENILSKKNAGILISILKLTEDTGSFYDIEKIKGLFNYMVGKQNLSKFKIWAYENRLCFQEAIDKIRQAPIDSLSRSGQNAIIALIDKIYELKSSIDSFTTVEKIEKLAALCDLEFGPDTLWIYEHLRQKAALFDNAKEFLKHIAINKDTDFYEPEAQSVSLMTMHASKGLEFPTVFIAGCEDGYMPLRRKSSTKKDDITEQEERRLFYVAVTRAKESLYFTYSQKRDVYGKKEDRKLSDFVKDIEQKLIKREKSSIEKPAKKTKAQMNIFIKL